MEEAWVAYIPDEILVEILCRLSRKSLCRLRCVSKHWRDLISEDSLLISKTTKARIALHHISSETDIQWWRYDWRDCKRTLLRLDSQGGASHDDGGDDDDDDGGDPSLPSPILEWKMHRNWVMLDSCNDFVLLWDENSWRPWSSKYIIFYPDDTRTLRKQYIYVPRPFTGFPNGAALAFDDRNDYIVVSYTVVASHCIEFNLYYSSERRWRSYMMDYPIGPRYPGRRPLSVFPTLAHSNPSLFFKGAMHWLLLPDYLLIYYLQDEGYCLIELPSRIHIDREDLNGVLSSVHIWENLGHLNFSQVWENEINIWVLYREGEGQLFMWEMRHSGVLVSPNADDGLSFHPIAFSEDFGMLYIRWGNSIISYNPRTRKQVVAYTCLSETVLMKAMIS